MPTGNYISFSVSNAQIANVISQINAATAIQREAIKEEVATSTLIIESEAKRNAPVGGKGKFGGILRARIFSQIGAGGYGGRVWCDVPYGPYQEFGTGALVDVPEGWEAFALQFKGKGIRQVNIPAQHFIFNAWVKESQNFVANIKKILGVK